MPLRSQTGCPHTWAARNSACGTRIFFEQLPSFQQQLGIPAYPVGVLVWQKAWRSSTAQFGDWTTSKIYTDASSFYPKDSALRVVGWAAVTWCRLPGELHDSWPWVCGILAPGSTVAQGDAHAVSEALKRLQQRGIIKIDCYPVYRLWCKASRLRSDDGGPLWRYQELFSHFRGSKEVDPGPPYLR